MPDFNVSVEVPVTVNLGKVTAEHREALLEKVKGALGPILSEFLTLEGCDRDDELCIQSTECEGNITKFVLDELDNGGVAESRHYKSEGKRLVLTAVGRGGEMPTSLQAQ